MAPASASPATPAPRRRGALATRQRLMEAGRKAFARKGLAGTILVDDILRPAGVSTGSFYHQFRDKNELLVAILDEHGRAFRDRLLASLEAPGAAERAGFVDLARACYGMALDLADEHGDLLRIQRRERDNDDPVVSGYLRESHEGWVDRLAAYYHRLAAAGVPETDCRLAAQLVIDLGLSSVALYQDLPDDERPAARERLLDALVRFTMGGLPALAWEPEDEEKT